MAQHDLAGFVVLAELLQRDAAAGGGQCAVKHEGYHQDAGDDGHQNHDSPVRGTSGGG